MPNYPACKVLNKMSVTTCKTKHHAGIISMYLNDQDCLVRTYNDKDELVAFQVVVL